MAYYTERNWPFSPPNRLTLQITLLLYWWFLKFCFSLLAIGNPLQKNYYFIFQFCRFFWRKDRRRWWGCCWLSPVCRRFFACRRPSSSLLPLLLLLWWRCCCCCCCCCYCPSPPLAFLVFEFLRFSSHTTRRRHKTHLHPRHCTSHEQDRRTDNHKSRHCCKKLVLSLSLSLFFCFFFHSCLYTFLRTLSCSGVCVFMLRERRAERDGAWRLTYYSF